MKETATAAVRLYPSTRRRLKIMAAQRGVSIAEVVDSLSTQKAA